MWQQEHFYVKKNKGLVHPDRPCHLSQFSTSSTTSSLERIIHQRPRRWSSRYAVSPAVRSLATNGRPISIYYKLIFLREMPLMNLDCVDIAAEGWWVFSSLKYIFCGVTFCSWQHYYLHDKHTILTLTVSREIFFYAIVLDVNTRGSHWKITELQYRVCGGNGWINNIKWVDWSRERKDSFGRAFFSWHGVWEWFAKSACKLVSLLKDGCLLHDFS